MQQLSGSAGHSRSRGGVAGSAGPTAAAASLRRLYGLPGAFLPKPENLDELQLRLEDAGRTLLALNVPGCWPSGMRSFWPTVVHDLSEAYGYTEDDMPIRAPSARAISRMDEALGWIRLIPLDPARAGSGDLHSRHGGAMLRRVVECRCLVNPRSGRHVFSWRRLGDHLHCNHEAARQWHARGLALVMRGLHRL